MVQTHLSVISHSSTEQLVLRLPSCLYPDDRGPNSDMMVRKRSQASSSSVTTASSSKRSAAQLSEKDFALLVNYDHDFGCRPLHTGQLCAVGSQFAGQLYQSVPHDAAIPDDVTANQPDISLGNKLVDAHQRGKDIPPCDSFSRRQGQPYNTAKTLNSSPQIHQGPIQPRMDEKLAPSVAFANPTCGDDPVHLTPAPTEHVIPSSSLPDHEGLSRPSLGLEGTGMLSSLRSQVPRKRQRVKSGYSINDGDEEIGSDDNYYITSKLPAHTGDDCTRGYACPFFKRDPVRYMDCLTRKLTRIRDVKQHIERRHTQPRFSCPVCYGNFSSAQDRDDHIRSRCCVPRSPIAIDSLDGVSRETLKLLKSRVSRTLAREQWYGVWDTIFSGVTRPESPYLDSTIEEIIGIIRNLWEREAVQILSNFPKRKQIQSRDNADATQLISELLRDLQVHSRKVIREETPAESPSSALSNHRDRAQTNHELSAPSSRETSVPFQFPSNSGAGNDLLVPSQQGRSRVPFVSELPGSSSCFQAGELPTVQGNYFDTEMYEDDMPGFDYSFGSDIVPYHLASIQAQANFASNIPQSFQLGSIPYQTNLSLRSDREDYGDYYTPVSF
ncbi:hypothetical protein OIDMADRAFT_181109 [Oidiodendron maius Zn]|uniref:C2H2-type domain-containing protein n=1 Tax=Oidiodendron maius (strain Zn) TaxID=913774 RepID=A0A0C3CL47_OIDMZ|nr:hypothetical protein OIDMADRAFT_181109 [Oidiodendron maius Zn]